MNIPDFTKLVLLGSMGLLIGLIFYYLLSIMKVFVLARVQPQILSDNTSNIKPFKRLTLRFVHSLLTDNQLHALTFTFLFRYHKDQWPQFDNKQVKIILNFLDGVTTFLKPYLIASIIFGILRIWIGTKLLYNQLTITLGQIQEILNFLHSIPTIPWIISHKALIYFFLGCAVIFIVSLAKSDKVQKTVKKSSTYAIATLSILLNVSFFSIGVASTVSSANLKLTKLVVEIVEIHNKIFVYAVETVTANEIDAYLSETEYFITNEVERLKKEASLLERDSYDSTIITPYLKATLEYIYKFKYDNTIDVSDFRSFPNPENIYLIDPLIPTPKSPESIRKTVVDASSGLEIDPSIVKVNYYGKIATPAKVIDDYYDKNIQPLESELNYDSYFSDKNRWNRLEGKNVLTEITVVRDKTIANLKTTPTRATKILELLFSFGLETGLDNLFEVFSSKQSKLLKKVTALILETKYKDCYIRASVKLMGAIKGKLAGRRSESLTCKMKPPFADKSKERIIEDNNYYLRKEQELLRKSKMDWISKKEEKAREERDRLITDAKEERERIARIEEEERLIRENAEKYHRRLSKLEQQIKDEIQSKDLGIPKDYSRKITEYLNKNKNTNAWDEAISQMLSRDQYNPLNLLSNNVENIIKGLSADEIAKIKKDMIEYLIPSIPDGSLSEYTELLKSNYTLAKNSGSIATLSKEVSIRDNISSQKFKSVFSDLCNCCCLPLAFPVCGCSL